jgi:hypothetical protein
MMEMVTERATLAKILSLRNQTQHIPLAADYRPREGGVSNGGWWLVIGKEVELGLFDKALVFVYNGAYPLPGGMGLAGCE